MRFYMKISKVDAEKRRAAVQADLKALKPDAFVMRKVLGATPIIFGSTEEYLDWKVRLSGIVGVDPFGIAIIGSACTGISLNPDKNYKQFDDSSDIDVAVVSSYHFDIAWRYPNQATRRWSFVCSGDSPQCQEAYDVHGLRAGL